MAVSRRNFLFLASGQLNPYSGPGKSKLTDVGPAEDAADEKRRLPVPVGGFRGADRCIGCGRCDRKCPQWQFKIPEEMAKIDAYVESLLRTEYDYVSE